MTDVLPSAAQRAVRDEGRLAACVTRVDALERAAAAAASSSAASLDASAARFVAAERGIDALRLEQQQVQSCWQCLMLS